MKRIFEQYITHNDLKEIGIPTDTQDKDSALYIENDAFISVASTSIDNITKKEISSIGFQNLTLTQQKAVKKATLFRINDWKASGLTLTRINGSVGTGGGSYSQSNPHEPDYIRSDIIDELESVGLIHIGDRHVTGRNEEDCEEELEFNGFDCKRYMDNYFVNVNYFKSKNGSIKITKGYENGLRTLNLETIIPFGLFASIDMDNLSALGIKNIEKMIDLSKKLDVDMNNITPGGLNIINNQINGNLNNENYANLSTAAKTIIAAINELNGIANANLNEINILKPIVTKNSKDIVTLNTLAQGSIDRDLALQNDMDNLMNSFAMETVEFNPTLKMESGVGSFPDTTLSIKPSDLPKWTSSDWTKFKHGAKVAIKLLHDDGAGKHTSEFTLESWNDGNPSNNALGKDGIVETRAGETNFTIEHVKATSRTGWSIISVETVSGGAKIDITGKADINLGNLDPTGLALIDGRVVTIIENYDFNIKTNSKTIKGGINEIFDILDGKGAVPSGNPFMNLTGDNADFTETGKRLVSTAVHQNVDANINGKPTEQKRIDLFLVDKDTKFLGVSFDIMWWNGGGWDWNDMERATVSIVSSNVNDINSYYVKIFDPVAEELINAFGWMQLGYDPDKKIVFIKTSKNDWTNFTFGNAISIQNQVKFIFKQANYGVNDFLLTKDRYRTYTANFKKPGWRDISSTYKTRKWTADDGGKKLRITRPAYDMVCGIITISYGGGDYNPMVSSMDYGPIGDVEEMFWSSLKKGDVGKIGRRYWDSSKHDFTQIDDFEDIVKFEIWE